MPPPAGPGGLEVDMEQVRVAARVRPLLPREKAAGSCSCVTVQAASRQVVVGTRRAFAFDVVFPEEAGQAEVFEECVAPLLSGCMQGYNATILAYGQTGSGKTHTMGTGQASTQSPEEEGIAPKLIRNSFAHLAKREAEVSFKATCCYIEIYNEEIRDLLMPGAPKHLIQVRETADGVIQVAGIHSETCYCADDMMRCLSDGSVQRTTGATLMNENSSRSHSIFTIIMEQRRRSCQSSTGTGVEGDEAAGAPAALGSGEEGSARPTYRTAKFHLVDLAGSERAKRTGAVGSRLRESVSINAGLLALGNVISALGDPAKARRGSHVPYRESKLTRLLQDGLGGNSRTLMIACASSADGDFEETLNTLKYAHRARNIKNKPVINQDPKAAQLVAMQDQIEALRSELQRVSEAPQPSSWPGHGEEAMACEQRNVELTSRLEGAEAECQTLRRALADVCNAVRERLPALHQALGDGEATSSKQALVAISAALAGARGVLAEAGDDAAAAEAMGGGERASGAELPAYGDFPGEEASARQEAEPEPPVGSDGLPTPSADAPGLRTLSEVRRDSTVLIRKYLDEIKRLEKELALYRKRTKQLQAELREAKEDLAKDEEIFEEKLQELHSLSEQNASLQAELCEALGKADGGQPGAAWTASHPKLERSGSRCLEGGVADERSEEAVRTELDESRAARQQLERDLQELAKRVCRREENIAYLTRSDREWATTKAQYEVRLQQLQVEQERRRRELAELHRRLQESAGFKEQTRKLEEEKQRLEQFIEDQETCMREKKAEFTRRCGLRQQDSKRIQSLEAEVSQMASKKREMEARLETERRREAQQTIALQRIRGKEGQHARGPEKQSLKGVTRMSSFTPLGRRADAAVLVKPAGGAAVPTTPASHSREAPKAAARPRSLDPAARSGGTSAAPPGTFVAGGSSPSSAHAERLLDQYIRRQEAALSVEEDQRKKDALVKKQQQYTNWRRKIVVKDASEQQEAREQLEQFEKQLLQLDRELAEAGVIDEEAVRRAEARREAVAEERAEMLRTSQANRSGTLEVLHEVDEKLEVLQDEIDFKEARITKARQLALEGTAPDAELANLPAEDARALLCRYCEKIVKIRQRERQNLRRQAASEAQLQERCRQVAELQQVLRSQSANASRYAAKVAKEYEAQIQSLQKQLEAAQQPRQSMAGEDGAGAESDASDVRAVWSAASSSEAPTSGLEEATFSQRGSKAGLEEAVELEQLRRERQYLRTMNRDLKRRLRSFSSRGERGTPARLDRQVTEVMRRVSAPAGNGGSPVEELAMQVKQLQLEKEALAAENRRVMEQVRGLKEYNSRYHNINAVGSPSEAAPEVSAPPPG